MQRSVLSPILAGFTLLAGTSTVLGQALSGSIDTQESQLSYTGDHFLHGWTGISRSVTGSVQLDVANPATARIEISAPVESFDSGNDNRDSNMMDVVDIDRYPTVRFVSDRIEVSSWQSAAEKYTGRWIVHGQLTFHGRTHPVVIPTDVEFDGKTLRSTGAFSIELDQYDVKRPRLLLRAISNEINLEGKLVAGLSATP